MNGFHLEENTRNEVVALFSIVLTEQGGKNLSFKGGKKRRKGERATNAFSNGINALLITRPERKIYLSSPGICDQGISASVLLRDEN